MLSLILIYCQCKIQPLICVTLEVVMINDKCLSDLMIMIG